MLDSPDSSDGQYGRGVYTPGKGNGAVETINISEKVKRGTAPYAASISMQ
jgi:hypothetical protein